MKSRNQGNLCGRAHLKLALCVLLPALALQGSGARARAEENLHVTPSFTPEQPVTPITNIELRFSRELFPGEGRLAIVIGNTDVTSLFIADATRHVYSPSLIPLPLGESPVVVSLVGADGTWRQLARFALQVAEAKPAPISTSVPTLTANSSVVITTAPQAKGNSDTAEAAPPPASSATTPSAAEATNAPTPARQALGFEKLSFAPSVTIAIKSQMAQFNFPDATRPAERATFTDVTMQFSVRGETVRGPFASQTQFDLAGSTFQQEALRFGTLGNNAPKIDLASYSMQFQVSRAKVTFGQSSFGTARHLVNSFSSRGITITLPVSKRVDVTAAVMNGTNVVGYSNFFGVSKPRHQIISGAVGVELLPKRPGGLRLEFSALTAYVQGLNSVSQGSVNDVERSKGGSVRLLFTDQAQRLKFDGGFTRSQYRNPEDPLLYQGTNTIPVPFLTRNAHYIDVSYDVLRGFKLTKTKQANLGLAVRHEQVDPLFKSLGASAQPDKLQNELQLSGSVGEISVQAGAVRFNDNLRRIPSILRSLTRATRFSVALPAAALFGGTSNTSTYLPRLSYSFDRTHQFGASIPIRGGFETDQSTIPNQVGTNQTFSAEWQVKKLTSGYSFNRSFADNRQPGRAKSDFLNQTHSARLGVNPLPSLNLNVDLSRDSANDLESLKLLHTWRVGSTAAWNLNKRMTWTGSISNTIAGDRAQTSGSRNTEFDTQFSFRAGRERERWQKVQTQVFVRYANRYARSHDLLFNLMNLTRVQILNGGVTVTFF